MVTLRSLCLPALLAACAAEAPDGPPYRAEVLSFTGIEADGETPRTELALRTLHPEDLDTLRGGSFEIRRGGSLDGTAIAGSVVFGGRFAGGEDRDLRYNVVDGAIVPRDLSTLLLLTVYHHFERLVVDVPTASGFPLAELIGDKGPFVVFFEPRVRIDGEDYDQTTTRKTNAFFLPGLNQFAIARRSELEELPLAASFLVLAHEMGHKVFERTLALEDTEPCAFDDDSDPLAFRSRLFSEYVIAGLNEGFADLTAFAVTGGTNVLADEPAFGTQRGLATTTFTWDTLHECPSGFYCIGTLVARSLYQSFLARGGDARDAAARGRFYREVIAAFQGLEAVLRARGSLPPPALELCLVRYAANAAYDPQVLGAVVDALAGGMPESARAATCAALRANLGDAGFPTDKRVTCAD